MDRCEPIVFVFSEVVHPKLLKAIAQGNDFVSGSRFLGTLRPGAITGINYLGNKLISKLIQLLYNTDITDSQAGFRAFRREALKVMEIDTKEYEVETEMLLKALKSGLRIKEVPVIREPRFAGKTGFKRIRNGLRILHTILRFKRMRDDPGNP